MRVRQRERERERETRSLIGNFISLKTFEIMELHRLKGGTVEGDSE
jgi:hypothetical protein